MGTAPKSITEHPLFPAVVTMWFGATFGLCSLVIGGATLENWVIAAGLPQYVAAAQPPLGSTARVLVALIACGIGALVGLALAAMLVRARAPGEEIAEQDISLPEENVRSESEPVAQLAPPAEIAPEEDPLPPAITVGEQVRDEAPANEPSLDSLAPFLRDDPVAGNAPRAPFSVFDELGPEPGIAPAVAREDEPYEDEVGLETADMAMATPHPIADIVPIDDTPPGSVMPETAEVAASEPDTAPPFAGSPPLPSNVHAIDPARMEQVGLRTSFAKDAETAAELEAPTEDQPSEPDAALVTSSGAPAGQAAAVRAKPDLTALSYLQLTERLAQAIARNPRGPARLRGQNARGVNTAVTGPGLDRLREVHARTDPANESPAPTPEEIRNALSGLRNIGGQS